MGRVAGRWGPLRCRTVSLKMVMGTGLLGEDQLSAEVRHSPSGVKPVNMNASLKGSGFRRPLFPLSFL